MSDLRNLNRETSRGFAYFVPWLIAAIVIALAISAGLWWFNVATSGVRGEGDGVIQRNSADNWVDAQARFEENYQEYESTLVRIEQFHEVHLDDPGDAIAKTNWLGQISPCTDVAADYNADARNFLRADFRAADLPQQLDPATCTKTQENTP